MNRLLFLLWISLVALNCSQNQNNEKIIGSWDNEDKVRYRRLIFKPDSTFNLIVEDIFLQEGEPAEFIRFMKGRFTLQNDRIHLEYDSSKSINFKDSRRTHDWEKKEGFDNYSNYLVLFYGNDKMELKEVTNIMKEEIAKYGTDYTKNNKTNKLIQNKKAGIFEIGKNISLLGASENYELKISTLNYWSEGVEVKEPAYIISDDGNDVLIIKKEYDQRNGNYIERAGEILILSDKFRTKENIGVGSTIEDFVLAYPDYKILNYIESHTLMIRSNKINAQFMLNQNDFIGEEGKIESDDDYIQNVKISEFKKTSKISEIKLQ